MFMTHMTETFDKWSSGVLDSHNVIGMLSVDIVSLRHILHIPSENHGIPRPKLNLSAMEYESGTFAIPYSFIFFLLR